MTFLNISYRRVGGLRFVKLGRLTFSWSIARAYRPLPTAEASLSRRIRASAIRRERRFAEMYASPSYTWIDITPEIAGVNIDG